MGIEVVAHLESAALGQSPRIPEERIARDLEGRVAAGRTDPPMTRASSFELNGDAHLVEPPGALTLERTMQEGSRTSPSDRSSSLAVSTLSGRAALHKVGSLRFPVYELVSGGVVLARLGRPGWWRIFFGRGQPIELADGTRWRLRAVGMAGAICPVIVDSDFRKVAQAAPDHGGYGINGKDWAYVFFPTERHRLVRANQWILRRHEENVGLATRTPWEITTTSPLPVGAAILTLTLIRYAIPGESGLGVPRFRW